MQYSATEPGNEGSAAALQATRYNAVKRRSHSSANNTQRIEEEAIDGCGLLDGSESLVGFLLKDGVLDELHNRATELSRIDSLGGPGADAVRHTERLQRVADEVRVLATAVDLVRVRNQLQTSYGDGGDGRGHVEADNVLRARSTVPMGLKHASVPPQNSSTTLPTR